MSLFEKSYFFLAVVQTFILICYAIETYRLRVAAASQTKTIEKQYEAMMQQLTLQRQQNINIQKDFERTLAREDMDAKPFIHFRNGHIKDTQERLINFENLGAEIVLLEMKCDNASFDLKPTHLIKGNGAIYDAIFKFPTNQEIYFGFKYLNRFKEVKTVVYHVPAHSITVVRNPRPYDELLVPRVFVQPDFM